MSINISNLSTAYSNLYTALAANTTMSESSTSSSNTDLTSISNFASYLQGATEASSTSSLDTLLQTRTDLLTQKTSTIDETTLETIQEELASINAELANVLLNEESTETNYYNYSNSSAITASDELSTFLQTSFQVQQLQLLTEAKERLQSQVSSYESEVDETSSESEQQRLEDLTNNLSLVDSYVTTKTDELSIESSLLSSLSASSALTKYLITNEA
ncbi:hypothetical protein [Paraliobacillus sediminis]|uniref:hypothetical protein n=1 Tax=Paraliobacillus sediminis TaxID=1885916 RepID=UPI000E3E1E43|nr:hypothetical protein [Paraliobacillus sediminis]